MLVLEIDPGAGGSAQEAIDACQQLLIELKMNSPEADIENREVPGIAQHRSIIAAITTVVVAGEKLGVFKDIFEAVKTWLASRPHPTAEVTIHGPNGSTLVISNASPEQAIQWFEQLKAEK